MEEQYSTSRIVKGLFWWTIIMGIILLITINNVLGDWANTSYTSCKNITITNPGTTTLSDFPVALNISYDSNMQTDFDDIVFYSAGCGNSGSRLSDELEYKVNSQKAHLWVKTNLSAGANKIAMYYNNATVGDTRGDTSAVWDSNYVFVLHSNVTDSTSNNNDGQNNGVTMTNGVFGLKNVFSGRSGVNINISDSTSLDLTNKATFEMVAYETKYVSGTALFDKYNTATGQRAYRLLTTSSTELQVTLSTLGTSGASNNSQYDCGFTNGAWSFVTLVYNGTGNRWKVYKNGQLCDTRGTAFSTLFNSNQQLRLGAQYNGAVNFNGSMDEMRISNNLRTPDYINATYQYFTSPTSFISFSSEINDTVNPCLWSGSGTFQVTQNCNMTVDYNFHKNIINLSPSIYIRLNATWTNFSRITTSNNRIYTYGKRLG